MGNRIKRTKQHFYSEMTLTSKVDVLEALKDFYEDTSDNGFADEDAFRKAAKREVIKRFYPIVEKHDLPDVGAWWNYECEITDSEVTLSLCHCRGIHYDPEVRDSDELEFGSIYPLIKMRLELISIESFANRSGVPLKEALKWLNTGKLYTAKIIDGKWFVSELQELPPPVFERDYYSLKDGIAGEVLKSYSFLNGCGGFISKKSQDEKIEIWLQKDPEDETVFLDEKEYESFLFSLVSYGCIDSNCISEVIDRKKTNAEKKWGIVEKNRQRESNNNYLEFGYVVVNKGHFKGRIGFYDDEEGDNECIVYFGDPILSDEFYVIKRSYISNRILSNQLQKRSDELFKNLFDSEGFSRYDYHSLLEYYLCKEIMNERYIDAMYKHPNKNGYKVFISYARSDLSFARSLATDLNGCGFNVFLAEISTDIGDNIIYEISSFLGDAIAFVALFSDDYNKSVFCRDEWTSFYNLFAKSRPNSIYPIILDNSEPPALISAIKYIRYNNYNYDYIFDNLLRAIKKKLPEKDSPD